MKRFIASFLLLASTFFAQGQELKPANCLWPIAGQSTGTNIISAPQGYIDGELNFDNMFIGAKLGDVVVSPTDGTVDHVGITYLHSLVRGDLYGGYEQNFDHTIARIVAKADKSIDAKYLAGSLTITVGSGTKLHISGLTGDKFFKTGQRIKRGDTLGRVGYSYHKIKEPSINVAISVHTKSADPMTPFGLKSSFIAPADIKPIATLTKAQAKEDFLIYINTLKEAYPGLYDVLTPEELEQYIAKTVASIDTISKDVKYDKFRGIIKGAVSKIHDSHISLYPTLWEKSDYPDSQPQVYVGWIGDTLRCTQATKQYAHLIGKPIAKVNGYSADSARKIVVETTVGYDAKVKHYVDYHLATIGFGILCGDDFDIDIEFTDGEKVKVKGQSTKSGWPRYVNNWGVFMNANRHRNWYSLKMINDSTAYVGLTTFELNQVQVEEIAAFIDSIAAVPNLIVDVRNNSGGNVEPLEQLYSYIAGAPMELNGYCKVNKKGNFEHFKYSMNYNDVMEIFGEYKAQEGKDGFYYQEQINKKIVPDSAINYKGRVYVLTNENSISAATLFPALLVRNHRGVVVGRETRTAYHFMNAMKFADIRLPNSLLTVRIPLVECVFDTIVNARVPYGRGVIPDYIVPLTLDEITFASGDAILNYTLDLIDRGKYLECEDPFAVQTAPKEENSSFLGNLITIIVVCTALVLVIFIPLALRRRRRD